MSLESSIFEKRQLQWETLEPFGFVKTGDTYVYHEAFMDSDFEAVIQIDESGEVTGQVIDKMLDEEYLPLRVERNISTFVGQVREAYMAILTRIAEACFHESFFASAQANRLMMHLHQTFSDQFDYPFAKYPHYISYRVAGKWYALLFPLSASKLDGISDDDKRQVDVVNIKVNPADMERLLAIDGIYPSYHMSKKSWISIVLDDSVADDVLFDLVAKSRQLVGPKYVSKAGEPTFWILPANPKFYDIDTEFATHEIVDWTQKGAIATGDIVAIYITAPVQSVRYLCKVVATDVANSDYLNHPEIEKFMQLKLLAQFPDGQYDLAFLKEHGVKAIRGPRRLTKELAEILKKEV